MSELPGRLRDLRDHPLWRVLGVYAVSAWITLLVVQVLTGALGLPGWVPDLVLVLLLAGLPPVLALAHLRGRDGAPELRPLDGEARAVLLRWGGGVLLLVLVGGGGALWLLLRPAPEPDALRPTPGPRVAVLPYGTAGADRPGQAAPGADALDALALALHQDLLLRLAVRPGGTVLSAEAVGGGPGGAGDDPVARALGLGAETVVAVELVPASPGEEATAPGEDGTAAGGEGAAAGGQEGAPGGATRRRESADLAEAPVERPRLRARILDRRGRERWEGDLPLPLEEAQESLLHRILEASGWPEETADAPRWAHPPLPELAALIPYARGLLLLREAGAEADTETTADAATPRGEAQRTPLREAEALFLEAVEREPEFGRGWGALAETRLHLAASDPSTPVEGLPSPSRLREAAGSLDRALRLDAGDPLIRLVLGRLHLGPAPHQLPPGSGGEEAPALLAPFPGGVQRALQEHRRAAAGLPGWAPAHRALGETARRAGRWEDALRAWHRAGELDAGVAATRVEVGRTLHLMRRYAAAREHLEAALELDPAFAPARHLLFQALLNLPDGLDGARALLVDAPDPGALGLTRFQAHYYGREFGDAAGVAAESIPVWMEGPCTVFTPSRMEGTVRAFIGQVEASRRELLGARETLERRLAVRPDEPRTLAALGEVRALAGDAREGAVLVLRATERVPLEWDAPEGSACLAALARVRVLEGRTLEALEILEWVLALPGPLTPGELRLDPIWDPLRSNPRFQSLTEGTL